MLLYFLGSSVTYGSATGGNSFVEEIAKQTGWTCEKEAVSGTTLAVREGDDNLSYVARVKNFDGTRKPSKLVVQLSTNDATQNVPLGKISEGANYDTKTVLGAIEYIIDYAERVLKCEVVFYTNPYFENERYKKMVGALYAVQKKWDFEIVDFFTMRNAEFAELSRLMSDAIHPNLRGYQLMAEIFVKNFTLEREKFIQNQFDKI